MQKFLITSFALCCVLFGIAQPAQFYTNENGDRHLIGEFPVEVLETDSLYSSWFNEGYAAYSPDASKIGGAWLKNLRDITVVVYLGTWCGDSKNWVPKFVKLWDQLGLKRDQLKFIALYDLDVKGKYKQGPNGEEKDKMIHRVPTFTYQGEGKEIARMVEYPVNDLETDLAQIALGFPSKPNYRAANYLMKVLKEKGVEEIKRDERTHLIKAYRSSSGPSELNTLGYVYLESGRIEEALTVLRFNQRMFPYDHNVHDSYAEALERSGQKELAIENYRKVLLLDRYNEHATEKLQALLE